MFPLNILKRNGSPGTFTVTSMTCICTCRIFGERKTPPCDNKETTARKCSVVVVSHHGDLSVPARNIILKLLPKLLPFSSLMQFALADRVIIFYLYYALPH